MQNAKNLKLDDTSPYWHDRDRVVLPNGHAAFFLYNLLFQTVGTGVKLGRIEAFRINKAKKAGPPEVGHAPGVKATFSPLAQGLGISFGLAWVERRPRDTTRISKKAASPFEWSCYGGHEHNIIGPTESGASSSAEKLDAQFDLSVQDFVIRVRDKHTRKTARAA